MWSCRCPISQVTVSQHGQSGRRGPGASQELPVSHGVSVGDFCINRRPYEVTGRAGRDSRRIFSCSVVRCDGNGPVGSTPAFLENCRWRDGIILTESEKSDTIHFYFIYFLRNSNMIQYNMISYSSHASSQSASSTIPPSPHSGSTSYPSGKAFTIGL